MAMIAGQGKVKREERIHQKSKVTNRRRQKKGIRGALGIIGISAHINKTSNLMHICQVVQRLTINYFFWLQIANSS